MGVKSSTPAGTVSLADTAHELGIGVTTAYQLVARDEFPIPVRRIGRRMRVLRHDLDRYLRGELPGTDGDQATA